MMRLVAVYRMKSGAAVDVEVKRVIDDTMFISKHNGVYTLDEPVVIRGKKYTFDKFRLRNEKVKFNNDARNKTWV